mmetsp:Transcript_46363/g.87009  ORF Transcript_46363/g.87009 Transcript_46363/m.87009 type:complete len:765 (+) Transcript_46363:124-2418(+)
MTVNGACMTQRTGVYCIPAEYVQMQPSFCQNIDREQMHLHNYVAPAEPRPMARSACEFQCPSTQCLPPFGAHPEEQAHPMLHALQDFVPGAAVHPYRHKENEIWPQTVRADAWQQQGAGAAPPAAAEIAAPREQPMRRRRTRHKQKLKRSPPSMAAIALSKWRTLALALSGPHMKPSQDMEEVLISDDKDAQPKRVLLAEMLRDPSMSEACLIYSRHFLLRVQKSLREVRRSLGLHTVRRSKGEDLEPAKVSIYRPQRPQSHSAEITRGVQQLLNIVCPENLTRVVERFEGIMIEGPEDLELLISLIIRKVLAEPHYSETYADLVYNLRPHYAEFPPEEEGEPPVTFERVLLNAVQNEFEAMPAALEVQSLQGRSSPPPEMFERRDLQRKRALANIKFIGQLFLRNLLGVKVISFIATELLSKYPCRTAEDLNVECACQLLQAIGYTLDTTPAGRMLLAQLIAILADMRDRDSTLSKRLRYKIQDLLDLQQRGWQEKVLREHARTIEEVRRDAEQEAQSVGRGVAATPFVTRVAGVRPAYLSSTSFEGTSRPKTVDMTATTPTAPVAAAARQPTQPTLNRADVRRMIAYFDEDRDPEKLIRDWREVWPRSGALAEEKGVVGHLLEIGFGSGQEKQQSACAEAIAALVSNEALPLRALQEAMAPLLGRLEDLRLDAPHADRFFEQLLAKLLLCNNALTFIPAILEPGLFTWPLLLGTLRWVRTWGGPETVQRAIGRKELSAALRSAGQYTRRQLAKTLRSEGIVS